MASRKKTQTSRGTKPAHATLPTVSSPQWDAPGSPSAAVIADGTFLRRRECGDVFHPTGPHRYRRYGPLWRALMGGAVIGLAVCPGAMCVFACECVCVRARTSVAHARISTCLRYFRGSQPLSKMDRHIDSWQTAASGAEGSLLSFSDYKRELSAFPDKPNRMDKPKRQVGVSFPGQISTQRLPTSDESTALLADRWHSQRSRRVLTASTAPVDRSRPHEERGARNRATRAPPHVFFTRPATFPAASVWSVSTEPITLSLLRAAAEGGADHRETARVQIKAGS